MCVWEKRWLSGASCSKPTESTNPYRDCKHLRKILLLQKYHEFRLGIITTDCPSDCDIMLNLLYIGQNKYHFSSFFFFVSFHSLYPPPLRSLTQARCSVGVLRALLVNQRIIPIALWLKSSLLLCCSVIGKSYLPSHAPWDTHTLSPEGWREHAHHSRRDPDHLQKPEPGKAPGAQMHKDTHKQPFV